MLTSSPSGSSVFGLDIGSNTFSLCEVAGNAGRIEVIQDFSIAARLSEGATPGSALKPAAVARALTVLEQLVNEYQLKSKPLHVVGTAVLRMVQQPEVFTEPAAEILGCPITILTGEQEAEMVSSGAVIGLAKPGPWIVVDVGGQSTEFHWREANQRSRPLSLPHGVVGTTAAFLSGDPPTMGEIRTLREHFRSVLHEHLPPGIEGTLLCVAGTATALGSLELGHLDWQPQQVHGSRISRQRLEFWLERMLESNSAERTSRYGIGARRADIFPAGLSILAEILDHLGRDALTVSVNGLRVGAALALLNQKDS